MKPILVLLMLACAILSTATEKPYFIHGDLHALGGYPMVGAGVRVQKGIHAFDFSGNVCALFPPATFQIFHVKSLYLVYPSTTGFYVGAGLGILNEPETVQVSGSWEGAIGYQWKNRVFLEANAIAPFKQSQTLAPAWPGLTLGVGF